MSQTQTAEGQIVALPAVHVRQNVPDIFNDPAAFEHAQRVAKVFASAELVPAHLRGKMADCLIAYSMARRMGEDPLMVMQNIYFVSGRAGWKTEYMIARANRSGVFKGRISWRTEGTGKDMAVTARAALADTGEEVTATASLAMAEAEGWTKNAKYRSMPEHMLRWRSATMLVRLYCPEVMMGLPTVDETEDVAAALAQPVPRPTRGDFAGMDGIGAAQEGAQEAAAPLSFTDADGTIVDYEDPADFIKRFEDEIEANKTNAAVLDGLWETNSPLLQRIREIDADLAERPHTAMNAAKADLNMAAAKAKGWTFTDTAGKLKTVKTEGDFIVALKSALIGLDHAPTAVGKLMAANAEMLDRLEATSQQDWAALRTQARDGGWEG